MKIKFIILLLFIIFIFLSSANMGKRDIFSVNDEIFLSIKNENLELFKNLLKNYNVNARNENGRTFLMEASFYSSIEIVEYLISNNADINIQDNGDNTALVLALEKERDEIVEILLNNGANINLKPKDKSLFLIACSLSSFDIIKKLVEKGVDYKDRDNEGKNGLMLALDHIRKIEVFEYLIKLGIDVNERDDYGNTALLIISRMGHEEDEIEFLIDNGAEVNAVNDEGMTALDYEIEKGSFDNDIEIAILKKAGAKRGSELKKQKPRKQR